jgi:hypothetical protein
MCGSGLTDQLVLGGEQPFHQLRAFVMQVSHQCRRRFESRQFRSHRHGLQTRVARITTQVEAATAPARLGREVDARSWLEYFRT